MSVSSVQVPEYLKPPCHALWEWQDNGDSIAWCSDGEPSDPVEQTVAFRSQLKPILDALVGRMSGLPSLSAILVVLDACSQWDRNSAMSRVGRLSFSSESPTATYVYDDSGPVARVTNWLADIADLPRELRCDLPSQVAIVTCVSQGVRLHRLEVFGEPASDVITCLGVKAEHLDPAWGEAAGWWWSNRMRTAKAFETLIQMAQTPINEEVIKFWRDAYAALLPKATELETLPETQRSIGESLRDLSSDDQWGEVAKTAIAAASVLSLPRKLSDPDVLRMGGVSDISNRGDPERLLMSELAQDPMVMLARIASGQALYLRRETPPGPSPKIRPVLVECGIRTWGRTRLKIASVALAIAAVEERRGETTAQVISIAGEQTFPEDFTSRDGVIKHLKRLRSDEHPGDAIQRWMEQIDEQGDWMADPVIIVSAATDADSRFRMALAKIPCSPLVFRIERNESATLLRRTSLGDETLQSLSLKVPDSDSTTRPKVQRSPRIELDQASFALFHGVKPCPLRFPNHLDGTWSTATTSPDIFTVTRDRRLLWFDRRAGGRQVHDRLPYSNVLAHELLGKRLTLVVGAHGATHYLIEIDLNSGESRSVALDSGSNENLGYVFDRGALFRFGQTVDLFDRVSGACVQTKRFGGDARHIGGPLLYVHHNRQLLLLSRHADGIKPHRSQNPFPGNLCPALAWRDSQGRINLIDRFCIQSAVLDPTSKSCELKSQDRRGRPGAVYVTSAQSPTLEYLSADGRTLVVSDASVRYRPTTRATPRRWKKISLNERTVSSHAPSDFRRLLAMHDPAASQLIEPRNLLMRMVAIEFDSEHLIVVGRRNRRLRLARTHRQGALTLQAGHWTAGRRHHFGRTYHPQTAFGAARWGLRSLKIGDNQVIADSRGLLHLRKGDDLSELTLAMYEPCVSGWRSWGKSFGDGYFTGMDYTPVYESVLRWLKEFVQQCKRSS